MRENNGCLVKIIASVAATIAFALVLWLATGISECTGFYA